MAQITIEVPDEIAQQLTPFEGQLSELFTRLIAAPLLQKAAKNSATEIDSSYSSATYQEILDFLISRPTSEQIIGFKVSEASQERLRSLLSKNRESALTPEESTELNLYDQLDNMIGLLKAKAYTAMTPQS